MRWVILYLITCLSAAHAFVSPLWRNQVTLKVASKSHHAPVDPHYGAFQFDQMVDHFNATSNTTFKQRYWANTDWYVPGGPVILYNAGETPADDRSAYVTNSSMAELARQLNGIMIVIEHRSYGKSQPGQNYAVEHLRTLSTRQALEDMAHFIRQVELPNLDVPLASHTKWIVYGGSYSGNLAAWMRLQYPDLVFAAVASSAPVMMQYNFEKYFETVQRYGPEHCINAMIQVIRYVDHILFHPFGDKKALRERFGVKELDHDDDFAQLLAYPLGLWQEMTPDKNPFQDSFCSLFDNATTLHEYIDIYGRYIGNIVKESCQDKLVNDCFGTYDPQGDMYTNISSTDRPWFWQVCTEYSYWQTGPPIWRLSSVASRKLTTSWYQHQCPLMFGQDAVPPEPAWKDINSIYGGWNIRLSRVFWVDGEWDPWRTLSVQSDDAPDRSFWNDDAHFSVLPRSVHHWDFFMHDKVDAPIQLTQQRILHAMKLWLSQENGTVVE